MLPILSFQLILNPTRDWNDVFANSGDFESVIGSN